MKRRVVIPLLAALALPAGSARAQQPAPQPSTLPAFRSEAEMARFVRALNEENVRRRRARGECVGGGTVVRQGTIVREQQPAVIRGRVTGADGRGLASAIVQVSALNARVTASGDGSFRLVIPAARLSAPRTVTVSATRLGTSTTHQRLSVAPGDSAVVDFQLCSSAVALNAITVMGVGKAGGAADAAESVTNTQSAGVDEGGIVKVHGDYLVMLRRGRLFTVAIGDRSLTPVSAVDAFGPGIDGRATWYDELLISGDRVVVIGYSYQRGGTELGLFDIDREGRLRYHSTWHLRSNDYYSSRNYASRLVGNELVFYTSLGVLARDTTSEWLPALRRWHTGAGADEFRPIAAAPHIYRPGRALDAEDELTLHTVTTCDLSRPELSCRATGVLGPRGRVFYVSPTSVYVWVSEWRRSLGGQAQAMVYRLPLDGSAPTALGAAGTPVDQFSFMEDDGHLNVLVRSGARGEEMWGSERAAGYPSLLRVPLRRFGNGSAAAPRSAYRALPGATETYTFQNRFVGRHLLYGSGSGWGGAIRLGSHNLYVAPLDGGRVEEIELPHGVDRIDVMGGDAVVIGTDGSSLHFSGIDLGHRPRVKQRYVSRGASQGELRSHGFFYKPDAGDGAGGVLGLPIRGAGRPGYEHLFNGSASIVFLRNDDGAFRRLGELDARPEGSTANDGCVASCVDWYGNARPLFLRGRVFALLGYEIVEGELADGRLREVRRVSYAPQRAEASRR